MRGWAALILAVALGLGLAWIATLPPASRASDAVASVFSAGRAMVDVQVIAREPHPTGSPANARVRDHLLARLTALGLADVAVRAGRSDGVRVENVIGRWPGADPALPALMLMAHYDSVPGSPGAADDAAGVAAILETLRAAKAAGVRPRRDIAVLLTDGEEAGLHGASAWFADDAQARRIGAVLNLEARGGAGRVHMFETGPGNGALIGLFGRTVASPSANSLMRFVYERMPNGTDFTLPKRRGIAGLNFAFMGDYAAYHTPLATPERLDQGSLQHMGDQALALTRALVEAPNLPAPAPDRVYADLFGLTLIHYSKPFGWVVLAAAAALLAVAVGRTRPPIGGVAFGAVRLIAGVVLAAALLFIAGLWVAQPTAMPSVALREASPWILAGFTALIGVAVLLAHARLRGPEAAWIGALAAGLLLAGGLQALAPETAFVLAWPVLWGAAMAALLPLTGRLRGVVAIAAAAAGLAWIAVLHHLLFLGVGFLFPAALASGALLAPLVLHPLLPVRRPPDAAAT